uniref:Odorant receptor n=1 Tax=Trichogramma kaykai TaxID=54128 RepID=A0ABD2WLK3_9HYME
MLREDNGQFENYDPFRMTRLLHKVARSWPPDETNHRHGILRKFLHVLPPIICIVLYIYNLSGFMTARTVEDVLE